MGNPKAKKQKCPEGSPEWMTTMADMNQLLLTFFIMLIAQAHFDPIEMQLILSPFQGSFGILTGGQTMSPGRFAEMGNTMESLPSDDRGRGMAKAIREAQSIFQPEIRNRTISVTVDERGLIISLSADAYFRPATAELDLEVARRVLEKLSTLFISTDFAGRNVRIEGHTDNMPTDPDGPWPTNWQLSTARALNVLGYIIDYGANPSKFSVAGYGEYHPILPNDTEEHRAKNRRVDIVVQINK